MRALQSLVTLFPCAGLVFAQQHRVVTSGPNCHLCKAMVAGIISMPAAKLRSTGRP